MVKYYLRKLRTENINNSNLKFDLVYGKSQKKEEKFESEKKLFKETTKSL